MSDPRGRGLKRGNGKWHRPVASWVTPARYGWKLQPGTDDKDRLVYRREGYELRATSDGNGWVVNEIGSTAGELYPGWDIDQVTEDVFPDAGESWGGLPTAAAETKPNPLARLKWTPETARLVAADLAKSAAKIEAGQATLEAAMRPETINTKRNKWQV